MEQSKSNAPKRRTKVKSFAFPIDKVINGEADAAVNTFSDTHQVLTIQLGMMKQYFLYQIVYRE